MVAAEGTTGSPDNGTVADRLGIQLDMVVQEIGWDTDVSDEFRIAIEQRCGGELGDEDTDDVFDVVLLWWRAGDGDLVDALVDATATLTDDGAVWVLSPKTGRQGYVEPADIAEAAPTAGLSRTSTSEISEDWAGTRLVWPKAAKNKR